MALQLAQRLVQTVGRAFYDDDAVVLLDALTHEAYLIDYEKAGKGPLEDKFGLQAKQVRRTLAGLYEDCLVEREKREWKHPDAPKGTRKKNHIFYYINYRHFAKLIRLRLHFMQQAIQSEESARTTKDRLYVCPTHKIEFSLMEAVSSLDEDSGRFICPRCMEDNGRTSFLQEIGGESKSASSSNAKPKSLKQKRAEQMVRLVGFHEGIEDILNQIDSYPVPPPENLPKDHIDNITDEYKERVEREKHGEAMPNGLNSGSGGSTSAPRMGYNQLGPSVRVQVLTAADEEDSKKRRAEEMEQSASVGVGALPAWMQMDVTGAVSSNALQDRKEREQKRTRVSGREQVKSTGPAMGGAAALLEKRTAQETTKMIATPPAQLVRSESQQKMDLDRERLMKSTFANVRGQQKPLSDMTKADEDAMTHAEYGEYAFKMKQVQKSITGAHDLEEAHNGEENDGDDDEEVHDFF